MNFILCSFIYLELSVKSIINQYTFLFRSQHVSGGVFSRCIEDPFLAFGCLLFFGRFVVLFDTFHISLHNVIVLLANIQRFTCNNIYFCSINNNPLFHNSNCMGRVFDAFFQCCYVQSIHVSVICQYTCPKDLNYKIRKLDWGGMPRAYLRLSLNKGVIYENLVYSPTQFLRHILYVLSFFRSLNASVFVVSVYYTCFSLIVLL